jgi:hypothetical protein
MTQKNSFLLLAIFLASPLAQAEEPSRALLDRIEVGCKKSPEADLPDAKATCGCVKKNYAASKKWSEEEIEMMARSYEQDPKAEQELQADKYSALIEFDYAVTDGCLKSAAFRYR